MFDAEPALAFGRDERHDLLDQLKKRFWFRGQSAVVRLAFSLSKHSREESWSLRAWVFAVAVISAGGAILTGGLAVVLLARAESAARPEHGGGHADHQT